MRGLINYKSQKSNLKITGLRVLILKSHKLEAVLELNIMKLENHASNLLTCSTRPISDNRRRIITHVKSQMT